MGNVNNPYSDMLRLMEKHGSTLNPPSIQLGVVITTSPLSIKTGDVPLMKEDLLVAQELQPKLNQNDTVALIELGDYKFLIICKVEVAS